MKVQRQQGLTLIEVLVAITIFAVVSVAVLAMFPTIFKLNGQTRADQAVTIGAKQFMENVRVKYSSQGGFDVGTLPDVPAPSTVNGYICVAPAPTTQLANAAGQTLIRRVTLTCTRTSQPTQTFVLDLGRPL